MNDMDDIIEVFHRATTLTTYNPSSYNIEMYQGSLFTTTYIPKDTCLGEIHGDHEYTWDISFEDVQTKYLILTEDFALDVSKERPRNILSYIRYCTEGLTPTTEANCQFIITNYTNGDIRVFLYTMKDIQPNEELLYEV
jgi:hypothetical protein